MDSKSFSALMTPPELANSRMENTAPQNTTVLFWLEIHVTILAALAAHPRVCAHAFRYQGSDANDSADAECACAPIWVSETGHFNSCLTAITFQPAPSASEACDALSRLAMRLQSVSVPGTLRDLSDPAAGSVSNVQGASDASKKKKRKKKKFSIALSRPHAPDYPKNGDTNEGVMAKAETTDKSNVDHSSTPTLVPCELESVQDLRFSLKFKITIEL